VDRVRLVFLAAIGLAGCARQPEGIHISGETMGTTWHATIVMPRDTKLAKADWRGLLQRRLNELDAAFTNWRDDAPVSRFNGSRSTGWQDVPRELLEAVRFARDLSRATDGAFDITIAPLVDLWGFGPKGRVAGPPSPGAIGAALRHVGWEKLETRDDPPALRKLDPETEITVSAMADGYACDDLAALLRSRGLEDFLIEIGGAVIARGTNAQHRPWRAGIQRPHAPDGETLNSVELRNQALSTSGVYRQYFESGGQRLAHVLDARTGRPIAHELVSVSVVHESAFAADGWDTALLILGPVEGRKLAERLKIEAMFLRDR
jgi:FAD:protein FMN transferase